MNSGDVLKHWQSWWGRQFQWKQATNMGTATATPQEWTSQHVNTPEHYMLWIDGVGGYLVCLGQRVSIGGPPHGSNPADIPLLANLSRRHADIVRGGEGYLLEALGACKVADRPVEGSTPLHHGYTIELGGSVRLRFRLPSVLSATAVLDFISDHRPSQSVDGVILLDENCLLGPGRDNHVQCPEWSESALLYRKDGKFRVKSQSDLVIGGKLARDGGTLEPGEVVSGLDMRFWIEETR